MESLDHELVKAMQRTVGAIINGHNDDLEVMGRSALKGEDQRQYARGVINDVVADHSMQLATAGLTPWGLQDEQRVTEAVYARLFGAGRLQHLLDDEQLENADINGCDQVFLTYADGTHVVGEPVASSDDELVEMVRTLGAYAGLNSRPFDAANPQLDLRLPDGSRLSALMRATTRPAVSIRRNRLRKVMLSDLTENGTLGLHVANFLSAAVLARKNIMIAGATNAGKTTLLRALVNEIPPYERLITVEKSLELGIGAYPDLHPNVVECEEILPNSEGAGGLPMGELVRRTLRMNPKRVIVGEVLGSEIQTMLNAMSQGNDGSLSTIHARSARGVFDRIATYCKQAEEKTDPETAAMLVAGALDFVVFIEQGKTVAEGQSRRYVASVLQIEGHDNGSVQANELWAPGRDGRGVRTGAGVIDLDHLIEVGYTPDAYPDMGWAAA